MELKHLPPFRRATTSRRRRIMVICNFLEEVVALTGAYDGFNTTPFPSRLNWQGLGECQLEMDLMSVWSSQLYGPRCQRLLVLMEHPTLETRQLLGCKAMFFEKVLSHERDCQYLIIIDQHVVVNELSTGPGRPGIDSSSPSCDLLSDRIFSAQSTATKLPKNSANIMYYKDRGCSYDVSPDPADNLAALHVTLKSVFEAHETSSTPLNVLVVVGDEPTRSQATVELFKNQMENILEPPSSTQPAHRPRHPTRETEAKSISFTFLQTGRPGLSPGMFGCCRDDGVFCSALLSELEHVSPRLLEVLRPSALEGCSLSEFLDLYLPAAGIPPDPLGGYRVARRGLCVASGPLSGTGQRPCAPCQASRLCGGPKSCLLQ
eukprot:TRINITY_DN28693_c0_g1_i2.p1 TRINITY_DN28693_c0_g1~~TRINITY_DN28693_c0_g1_i2.p1  ORF type:complete len:376 (-),score=62.21 TRINITY_DN28693_c0_g1_i2:54-1181(-)